ncbi:MAG: ABC transporter permease [Deltaproteobacteria bacterium]|nr:ABC transporter permease [Deltaproteobacteria bacterium]
MISVLLRISVLSVRRDPLVLALTFLLPLAFFSIFAFIFGGSTKPDRRAKVALIVVDEDDSTRSHAFVDALALAETLSVRTESKPGLPVDRTAAIASVENGEVPVAVLLPHGFGPSLQPGRTASVAVDLYFDASAEVARQMVSGWIQSAAQRVTTGQSEGLVKIEATNVRGDRKNKVAYYAAGIAVMFLLFSVSGAAGALLSEQEGGTLERILTSGVSMRALLASYFLFSAGLGALQVSIMFLAGALVFELPLFTLNHLIGFVVMTVTTASAATAFGLMLATLCRSRAQLAGISTLAILVMSAAGGSMVPRFIMPPVMETVSHFTFNGWAIDGYLQVFWYDDPSHGVARALSALGPSVAVLWSMTATFALVALRFARRWNAQ